MTIGVGFTLQPEERYLALTEPLLALADYFEVAPETTWREGADGAMRPNDFQEHFARVQAASRKPFVAHGVGFSVGSARPDRARRARWLAQIRADHARFGFRWYTDHLGASEIDGRIVTLPLPLPYTDEAAACVRAGLAELQAIVPDVGLENSVFYAHFGHPLDEPQFVAQCIAAPRTHLLLDVHNAFTTGLNAGFDPWEYVHALPLERVVEIHLSGGAESDPVWLPSRRVLRLDAHDHAVPEDVWSLFERVLPLCTSVRGVTLERMEGTVEDEDHVALLRDELRRVRTTLEGARVRS